MINTPFVGLRPFKREESNLFFGREEHIAGLLALFKDQHLITVVGSAGSGKTSFINAGLMPQLLEGAETDRGGHWQIAEMRLGKQPFQQLAVALQAEQALDADLHAISLDAATLQGNPNALHELLGKYPFPPQNKLLIICDQFEDIFRYQSDEAAAFTEMLVASSKPYALASGVVSDNIYVLINLRSGYLKQCSAFPALSTVMNKGLYLLPVLNQAELTRAVERPVQMFGGSVEQELCIQLVEDEAQNHLPLLQLALLKLWQKSFDKDLTIFDYYVIGGVKSILSNHADQLFQSLTTEQQLLMKMLFKTIFVSQQQGGYVAQPVKLAEVVALAKIDRKAFISILELFRQESDGLVLPALPQPLTTDTLLDVAHESYCLQWHRLIDWLEEEARDADNYIYLKTAAQQHQRNHGPLLRSSELVMMSQWYDEAAPTENWSKRYGGEFKLTEDFLKKSKKMSAIKRACVLLAGIAIIVITTFMSLVFWSDSPQPEGATQYYPSNKQSDKQVATYNKSLLSIAIHKE